MKIYLKVFDKNPDFEQFSLNLMTLRKVFAQKP